MCDGYFTEPGIEAQIVRLEGSSQMENAVYVRLYAPASLDEGRTRLW